MLTTAELEALSLEDLRKGAEAEALALSTKTPEEIATEAAADAEAQRVATEAAALAAAASTAPTSFRVERTIDLGDGAGVQVFRGKGATKEEANDNLIDTLTEAQTHATKKIRELNAAAKVTPTAKTYTKDEEALYSAELMSTPTAAFKKLFKDVTGVDVEEFKTVTAREKAFQEAQNKKSIADQFVAAHPDFVDNDRNGKRINAWLTLHKDFSLDGFNKAYQDLSESGLLEVKGEEASAEQKAAVVEAQRIADAAAAEASSRQTRKASGLSTQRKTTVPVAAEPTEDDMYTLPLDEIRKRANLQLAR